MARAIRQQAATTASNPSFGIDVVAGSIIFICQVKHDWTGNPGAPTQAGGTAVLGTITEIFSASNGGYGGLSLYWALVTTGGSLTITGADYCYHMVEVTGANVSDVVEDADGAYYTGTSPTSPALSTAAETMVLFWFGEYAGGYPAVTPDTDYTVWTPTGNWISGGFNLAVPAGTPTPAFTIDASRDLNMVAVAVNVAAPPTLLPIMMSHGSSI